MVQREREKDVGSHFGLTFSLCACRMRMCVRRLRRYIFVYIFELCGTERRECIHID